MVSDQRLCLRSSYYQLLCCNRLAILSVAIIYNVVIVLPRAVFKELEDDNNKVVWFVMKSRTIELLTGWGGGVK